MSTYNWESGTIKLSTAEFPKVRKALFDAANTERARTFSRATELWKRLKAGEKPDAVRHNEGDNELIDGLFREVTTAPDGNKTYTRRTTPLMPRKKDFAPLPWKTLVFRASWAEGTVSFDPKARTVRWSVSENNHAVERARESWLGRAFFTALSRVNWTRGTGGTIVGNDEYNRDSDYEGGGGNYVTANYPPPPAPKPSAFSSFSSPRFSGYGVRGRWR